MNKDFYNSIVESPIFLEKLHTLNTELKNKLLENNYSVCLIGNLFYDHEQLNPPFYDSELLKDCEEKRVRFSQASKMRNKMFEIGLNGGHSSLLSLLSNDNIVVYSNDIAKHYPPCPNIHPEVYVPAAANVLKSMFHERFHFICGSCLTEIPKFVRNNNNIAFDLVHIDGDKSTYEQDFLNLMPLLEDNALIIFDDTQNPNVQNVVNKLIKEKYLHRSVDFPQMSLDIKYRNEILLYKK